MVIEVLVLFIHHWLVNFFWSTYFVTLILCIYQFFIVIYFISHLFCVNLYHLYCSTMIVSMHNYDIDLFQSIQRLVWISWWIATCNCMFWNSSLGMGMAGLHSIKGARPPNELCTVHAQVTPTTPPLASLADLRECLWLEQWTRELAAHGYW